MVRRIIVLGTMRSGTSLTAELVRLWGAYSGGEEDLWTSDVNDPRGYGYMEYIPLQNLNDELLEHNDRLPPPAGALEQKAQDPSLRGQALQLLEEMDENARMHGFDAWIWKDARLALTLPFWMSLWEDPSYIVTLRHPAEVTLSSARTEEMDPDHIPFSAGLLYWQYCMLTILSLTQASPRKMFVAYDQLLNDPTRECTRLCYFLDEQCGRPSESAEQRIGAMLPHISGSQRHHRYSRALAEMEQATREQRALYDFLRAKIQYPHEAFQESDFALYPGWREYLQAMDMVLALSQAYKDEQQPPA